MPAKFQIVTGQCPASGNLDFIHDGFGEVAAAIFISSGNTSLGDLGSVSDEAPLSFGITDGTNHRVMSSYVRHGSNRQDAWKRAATDEVVMGLMGSAGAVDFELHFDSFITDGARITVGVAPTTYTSAWITCILIGGEYTEAFVGTFDTTAADDHQTGVGFEPHLLFTGSADVGFTDTAGSVAALCMGVVSNDESAVKQGSRFFGQNQLPGFGTTSPYGAVSDTWGAFTTSEGAITSKVTFNTFDTSGFHARRTAAPGIIGGYLALRFQGPDGLPDTGIDVVTTKDLLNAKGKLTYALNFDKSQFHMSMATRFAAFDTHYQTADSGVFDVGVSAYAGGPGGERWTESCHSFQAEDGVSVDDAQSNTSDVLIRAFQDDGTDTDSNVMRLDTGGSASLSVEFLEASAAVYKQVALFIEAETDWDLEDDVTAAFSYDANNQTHHQFEWTFTKEDGTQQRLRSTRLESSKAASTVTIKDMDSAQTIHTEVGSDDFVAGPFSVFSSSRKDVRVVLANPPLPGEIPASDVITIASGTRG